MRLTRTGLGVLAAAVLVAALGLRWHYVELLVVAGAAAAAVALAWSTARRPTSLEIVPRAMPRRVARGDDLPVRVRVRNTGSRVLPPVVLVDSLLDSRAETLVSGLAADEVRVVDYTLRAVRRGVHRVGPMEVRRQDLLGVVSFERVLGVVEEVVVHPRVYDLLGARGSEHVSELENQLRRATSDPLSGFQSLRDYQQGDDTRTIHWPSTARMGRLVVREFADARRPRLTVVLDTSSTSHAEDGFEEAVDVAASLAAYGVRVGLEVVVRTTDRHHRGGPEPIRDEGELLELLARVQPTVGDDTVAFGPLVVLDASGDAVMVVTGPSGVAPRISALAQRLTVVHIGGRGSSMSTGHLSAPDAKGFQRAWVVGN